VGDDQLRFGVALDEPCEMIGDRRQASPAVDEDRDAPLRSEGEDRRQPLVVQQEALRPRVELDPPRARVERSGRLLDRLFAEIEPHKRDQAATRAFGERERTVVRGSEGRVPVGLVHAEDERPRDAEALLNLLEVLVEAAEAVDVVAQVYVCVRDLSARRRLAL
jgi:hypothetical protein